MSDGTGLAEALLDLDEFRVLAVTEMPDELVIDVETPPLRKMLDVRPADSRVEGRVPEKDLDRDVAGLLLPQAAHPPRRRLSVPTRRPVRPPSSGVAEELGVCWWAVMDAVIETPAGRSSVQRRS